MNYKYFSVYFQGEPFKLFSTPHIISLLIVLIVNVIIIIFSRKLLIEKADKVARYSLASILIITELSFQIWCIYKKVWTPEYNLPFHLCSAATIICIIMLIKKSYFIYELAYFWGLAGAMQALLTPDLSGYNYPHYIYFKFFTLHGAIIVSVVYMTFFHRYSLNFKSVIKAFLVTNLFAILTIPINIISGGNYLFLCRKPDAFTLLDCFGPWPWYIIPMEAIVFIMFVILYLPFLIKKYNMSLLTKQIKNHIIKLITVF